MIHDMSKIKKNLKIYAQSSNTIKHEIDYIIAGTDKEGDMAKCKNTTWIAQ